MRRNLPVAGARARLAFTLVEMLVVIAIIGIMAAISVPAIKNFQKSDAEAAATRQLLDDIARARQFAISQRSTVHMVFVPDVWFSLSNSLGGFNLEQRIAATNLIPRQMVGYNFVSVREVGAQPGQTTPKYLSEWRSLPEGMFIAPSKFFMVAGQTLVVNDPPLPQGPTLRSFVVRGFDTNSIPFPTADSTSKFILPSLTFNSLGQLVPNDNREEEIIPLARGRTIHPLDANKRPTFAPPTLEELPAGNSTNAFALIIVDRLTGRARIEQPTPQ